MRPPLPGEVAVELAPPADLDTDGGQLIRPYAMTGGRTPADVEPISLEAQIVALDITADQQRSYRWEAAKILQLTQTPLALIEIAALARIPIGVTRVIVADLVRERALEVQIIATAESAPLYRGLLERVLDGVRNI